MSNFACKKCGVTQQDSERGYVAGCCHYPPENSRPVLLCFGGDDTLDTKGFYWAPEGAWYKSDRAKASKNSVHPITWQEIQCPS